ncbi:MAG: hypothetical protein PHV20_06120 [Bacteroidales bacterium]|nr:hypothetical protein [Bacteroidales bacterium]
MDLLRTILTSDFGSFSFVASILALAFWLTHWVTKRITEIKSEHSTLSKTVSKMESHVDDIRKDLSYMKGSIDIIRSGANPATQSHSPISLTTIGEKIRDDLNANDLIAKNWDKIFATLEKNICDKNAYDIQEYCMETAAVEPEKLFDDKTLTIIKSYAYKQGNPFQYYSGVFAVLIRDKYLGIKGIDVSEVDANDPKNK